MRKAREPETGSPARETRALPGILSANANVIVDVV
jgi:hypothetical protein